MSSAGEDSDAGHNLASIFAASVDTEYEPSYDFSCKISKLLPTNFATLMSSDRPPQSLSTGAVAAPGCLSLPSNNSTDDTASGPSLKLILVKAVQGFIFKDFRYIPFGKVAAAILGNADIKYYQIIIYRDKKDHTARSYVTSNFWLGVQENNYASFFDCNNVIWTLMFDSKCDLAEFCIEIILAKWVCSVSRDKVLTQDVVIQENKKTIKQFDTVQINYIAWPLNNHGEQIKDSLAKGCETVILSLENEWEKYFITLSENSRKLLILPPSYMEPWEKIICVSCKYGILLDVTVKLIENNQKLHEQQPLANAVVKMVLPKLPVNDDDCDVQIPKKPLKSKNGKINELLPSGNSPPKKSELISTRMGCLGKALPLKGARVPAAFDSDTEEEILPTYSDPKPTIKPKIQKIKPKTLNLPSLQQMQQIVPSYVSQQHILPNMPVAGYPPLAAYTPMALSPVVDTQLIVLFSEIRSNNSELRMGLSRIIDKTEKVVDKIHAGSIDKISEYFENIDKAITNEFSQLNDLNAEIKRNFLKNSSFEDTKSVGDNTENESSNNKIECLQKENDGLMDKLMALEMQIKEYQAKISDCENENTKLQNQLKAEIEASDQLRKEMVNSVMDFHNKLIESTESAINKCSSKVQSFEQVIDNFGIVVDSLSLSSCGDKTNQTDSLKITSSMNNLYKYLKSQFRASTNYSSREIHDTFESLFKSHF